MLADQWLLSGSQAQVFLMMMSKMFTVITFFKDLNANQSEGVFLKGLM